MADIRIIASGLGFPEGPVWMADGSVILGEISGKKVTRVAPDGKKSEFGKAGGGPNGVATGPDGALYVCNNGGRAYDGTPSWMSTGPAPDYKGGSIQRIDPKTGATRTLYSECNGHKLSAPNDLVFDKAGGFYFTDLGKRYAHQRDNGGLYYALPDGSRVTELVYPIVTPNGVGLSPDEKTVYVADTETSRLFAWDIEAPGKLRHDPFPAPHGGRCVCGLPGFQRFDSLAVEASGTSASRRWSPATSPSSRPPGRWCARSRCPTSTRPTSASAARVCAPPTSRCPPRASSLRWNGRNRASN